MKVKATKLELNLNPESIDKIADEVTSFLTSIGTEARNLISIRLNIEELLLKWMNRFDENTVFTYQAGSKLGKPFITLKLKGEECDPTQEPDQEFGSFSARIISNMGLRPLYEYKNTTNYIRFKFPRKRSNPIKSLVIAIVLALAIGFLGMLLPEAVRLTLDEKILVPIFDTFLGVMKAIAGPLIFLSVAWGIYGIGDADTLGRIGKKMLLRFMVITFIVTIISMAVLFPFHHFTFQAAENASSEWAEIFALILNFFPKNIFSPFIDGNTTQIILIAIIVGIVMIILGQQTAMVGELIEQLNYIIQYLMELIGHIVSLFVFIILLDMIWSDNITKVLSAWKPIVLFVIVGIAVLFVKISALCIKYKVSPKIYLKKVLPGYLIGTTTASSSASFGTVMNCCEKKLGINNRICSFGIPIGFVLFKPIVSIGFVSAAYYFTELYNVGISLSWLVSGVIVITVLAIALPPIPGGALACYTILFSQLGIPGEALGIVVVIDIITDFICTGFDILMVQSEMVFQADKMNLLDKEILRKNC